ncbi:MAG: U32 family peptidase [Methanothrix sp.]|nr:U32 family peptidase [Methanothrix sp.]
MRRLPELLAPAGSEEALKAAIAAGADAVYLSGKRFGARKFAANFDERAMENAVDYAHLRGVKVYVTVNTLIREDELSDLARYLVGLYQIGVDAILLQDLGAALLARRIVPDLERHASTQMTIHNASGVVWAAHEGFGRAVLAREASLEEIREIGRDGRDRGVGLEVFVHGALCYSYSGQCLLSSAIGGRSGNRGMCAQPCRKPYLLLHSETDLYGRPRGLSAQKNQEKFLISTRDLCVYRHLDELVRSNVASLKIEGRMKSPEYVAVVTSIYRKALDAIARGNWSPSEADERDLALAFNRSFSAGHLFGARDVMGREMSDNRGVFMGIVTSFDSKRGEAAVRLGGSLAPEKGDGLVFQSPGQEMGLVVQKAEQKDGLLHLRMPERVRPGARVYLTGSASLARRAQEIIKSSRTEITLDLDITWQDGRPAILARMQGADAVRVEADFRMEKAKTRPLTRQQIESQLRRTGGTPFVVKKINMDYSEDLFAPIGSINQLRRELLERVEEALLQRKKPGRDKVEAAQARSIEIFKRPALFAASSDSAASPAEGQRPSLAVYASSLEGVKGAVEGSCDRIYFEPALGCRPRDQTEMAMDAAKMIQEAHAICGETELVWKWPKISKSGFFDLARSALTHEKVGGIMVESVGALQGALDIQPGVDLYGGMGLNVCNHLAVEALAPSLSHITLSPELSARQIAEAVFASRFLQNAPRLELVVQGSLEVMVAEDCIPAMAKGGSARGDPDHGEFWGLQDMRRIFPIRLDDESRTHIFNSAETCLLDHMPRIFDLGLNCLAVDARFRTAEYAREMTRIYKMAIDLTECRGETLNEDLQALKEAVMPLALGGITHGHFIKGLKDEIA